MDGLNEAAFDMTKICRFCLSASGAMSPIFDVENTPLPPLAARIMSFVEVQIFVNDGLPTMLCHRCLYMAEKAFDFKTRCEASDAMLRKYLSILQSQMPSIKAEPEDTATCTPILPIAEPTPPVKRKRGRPRKQENLIFYSSPSHPSSEAPPKKKSASEIKIVDGIESMVTVVDPLIEIWSNSDEERKELPVGTDIRNEVTMRHLALARAKAKKFMGVVVRTDSEGNRVRRHLCKSCGKTFGHCSDLRKHVLVHTGERPFHCQLCTKTFSRSTNLNKHLKVHSGSKPFTCSDCPKSFSTKGDLQRHLVVHSGVKPYHCHMCHTRFSRKDKLTRHLKFHCGETSESRCEWTGHSVGVDEEGENTGVPEVDSDEDGRSESASRADENETLDNVESMVISLDPFPVQPVKSSKVSNENGPTPPSAAIMDDKPHKCFLCFKSFPRRRELLRHESVHTGIKPFSCSTCTKSFSRKDKLTRHMKTHDVLEKTFFCAPCGLGFHQEESYLSHMAAHEFPLTDNGDSEEDVGLDTSKNDDFYGEMDDGNSGDGIELHAS